MSKSIGIALGGGGARGLAHVPVLQMIDDMGLEISAIAGTSIGAIIGGGYASGRTAKELRSELDKLLAMPQSIEQLVSADRICDWLDLLTVELGKSHILNVNAFVTEMQSYIGVENFAELEKPLKVVAADFWSREEVIFESGPLVPAISACFCLPGIFKPVIIDGRTLIDGGCVNPIPFDLLHNECDIVIAVDVIGKRIPGEDLMPTYSEAIFNSFQISSASISRAKMKSNPPDIYLQPEITGVKVLEFDKFEHIYEQATRECHRMKSELAKLLEA